MAELWGEILKFLGLVLNGIYQVIPSYGIAIILLTLVVRLGLYPLGVKQIRSMTQMQRIQPKLKELQKKHKGDRQKLNEETMKLYREHNVNPMGGCFPLLLQMPVFIALYAVIRSAVPFTVIPAPVPVSAPVSTPSPTPTSVPGSPSPTPSAENKHVVATIPFTKATVCRPVGTPSAQGNGFTEIRCQTEGNEQVFRLESVTERTGRAIEVLPSYVTKCTPTTETVGGVVRVTKFKCESTVGTGHLPKDGKLFSAIVQDKASFLGMHLACSPQQANSKQSIQQCTSTATKGAGIGLVAYYGLVVLMALTTWYQQKQMLAKTPAGPQAQQMVMMSRIMPLFMGFISLSFASALSLYWVVGNIWMIGQQHFTLKHRETPAQPAVPVKHDGKAKSTPPAGGRGAGDGKPAGKQAGKRSRKRRS